MKTCYKLFTGFTACLILATGVGFSKPAEATAILPVPWAVPVGSWAYYRVCIDTGQPEERCQFLAALFDPEPIKIKEFGLSITSNSRSHFKSMIDL